MAVSSFSVSGGSDSYLNASEIASGYALTYSLSSTSTLGANALILIKDGSGNLLYWYTTTSGTSATIPAGALGSYEGPIQIQAFQGTSLTNAANSGNYSGTYASYPSSSAFTYHDNSLSGTNTAVISSTAADSTLTDTLDTVAPTVTTVTDNIAASVTDSPISFSVTFSEAVTGVSTSSFSATNGSVASVTLVDSSHYTVLVNPTAGVASGNVALSLALNGATDTAGNKAVAANLSSFDSQGIDTVAPTGGTPDLLATSDSGTSTTDNNTNVTAPTFQIALNSTVQAGDTIQLYLAGSPMANTPAYTITSTDKTNGYVQLTVTDGDLGADGIKSITAHLSDAAGNTSNTTALSVTLDTTPPTGNVTTITSVTDNVAPVIGTLSNGDTTNDTAPAIAGKSGAASGLTVGIFDGSTLIGTTTTTSGGNWSFTPTLAQGTHNLTAVTLDTAGNAATTGAATFALTVDTTAPTGGTPDLTAASDSGTSSTDNITNDTSPTFQVALNPTVQAGDTIQLLLAGSAMAHTGSYTITSTDVTNGYVQLTVAAGDLGSDNTKAISARLTDAAGNTSTTSALTIALDTTSTAGNATTITSVTDDVPLITGALSNGATTNDNTPTLAGKSGAASGLLVGVFDGTTLVGTTTTTSSGNWSLTTSALADGAHNLTAATIDAAGNKATTGGSAAFGITVDTVAPTGGTPDLVVTTDSGVHWDDNITNVTAPAFLVTLGPTVQAGDTIQLLLGGSPMANTPAYTVTSADISRGFAEPTVTAGDLGADGIKSISAILTDAAGNTSTTGALAITLDTTAPTETVPAAQADSWTNGNPEGAGNLIFGSGYGNAITVGDVGNSGILTAELSLNLVTNGSFDTGNLNGWTLGGNYTSVPTGPEIYATTQAENGLYAATFGSLGSDGTLSQTLHTVAGQQYTLSFWLQNEGGGPNDFAVDWNGAPVMALSNASAQGYTQYTYTVTATGSTTTLEFDARQDPAQWDLDNISVTALGSSNTLTLSETNGITITSGANGSSAMTISGTAIDINAALQNAIYHTSSTDNVTGNVNDALQLTVTDLAGNGSTSTVNIDVICFMAGTLVRTPDGEVPVETLKRGDMVLTTEGVVKPVRWLGRQTVSMVFSDPLRVWPIRIKAGALRENVPARDLRLSPDHAVLVDGALIQAGALVNGTSIVRDTSVPKVFVYYHVELDDHSLILVENTPAETFIDNVDRLAFDNWAEHEALYPNGKRIEELPYPRAKAKRQVPVAMRVRLAERAVAIGAATNAAVA
jgi:hypothetical protein